MMDSMVLMASHSRLLWPVSTLIAAESYHPVEKNG